MRMDIKKAQPKLAQIYLDSSAEEQVTLSTEEESSGTESVTEELTPKQKNFLLRQARKSKYAKYNASTKGKARKKRYEESLQGQLAKEKRKRKEAEATYARQLAKTSTKKDKMRQARKEERKTKKKLKKLYGHDPEKDFLKWLSQNPDEEAIETNTDREDLA